MLQQNLQANVTQKELAILFAIFIDGMRRLDKCLQFLGKVTTKSSVPEFFVNKSIKPQEMSEYLKKYEIILLPYESEDLISRLGGNDTLSIQQFQDFIQSEGKEELPQAQISYVRMLHEEILLERRADEQRVKLMKRWDYSVDSLFNTLSNKSGLVDLNKFKKFFFRIRFPIQEQDISLLMRRIGNSETSNMSHQEFSQAIKTQKQRVNERVVTVAPRLMTTQSKVQMNYMDKLRLKYNLSSAKKQQQQNKFNSPPRQIRSPSRFTTSKSPISKQSHHSPSSIKVRTTTPTEPRYISQYQEAKEVNSLFSLYLNQQRCLLNVLAQLDNLEILKSIQRGEWEKEWLQFGINTNGISYNKFLQTLLNYDDRQPLDSKITILELPNTVIGMADNLFDLLRDQEAQLSKAKLTFLKEGSVAYFNRFFNTKGYMDVLDVLQLLENASSSSVNIHDAELLIARFNGFNGQRTIQKKTFFNELT